MDFHRRAGYARHPGWSQDTATRREQIASTGYRRSTDELPEAPRKLLRLREALAILGFPELHTQIVSRIAKHHDDLYIQAYPRPHIDGDGSAQDPAYATKASRPWSMYGRRDLLLPREPGDPRRAGRLYCVDCVRLVCNQLGVRR
jgi:hypothetical protein